MFSTFLRPLVQYVWHMNELSVKAAKGQHGRMENIASTIRS